MSESKLIVTQEILNAYIRWRGNTWKWVTVKWLAFAILVYLSFFFGSDGANAYVSGDRDNVHLLLFGFLFLALASVLLIRLLKTSAGMEEYGEQFRVLQRWEKISGQVAENFPLTFENKKLLVPWADRELRDRGFTANYAFQVQEESRKNNPINNSKGEILIPSEAKMKAIEFAERRQVLDSSIETAKQSFMNFWDLMKELDILRDEEYSNPQVFLRSLENKVKRDSSSELVPRK